jgi:hypothetical protein
MGGLVAHAVMDVQNGVGAQPRRNSGAGGGGRPATAVPMQPQSRSGSMARAVAH